jgi:hypothetical protein
MAIGVSHIGDLRVGFVGCGFGTGRDSARNDRELKGPEIERAVFLLLSKSRIFENLTGLMPGTHNENQDRFIACKSGMNS